MLLVKRHRAALGSFSCLAQARELGERLEQMVSRYEHLVSDVLCDVTPPAELQSRVRLLERELGMLAMSLQDQLVALRLNDEDPLSASA